MNTSVFFFFFQAEDGIRDDLVTGVQTCALPISTHRHKHQISRSASSFRPLACDDLCRKTGRQNNSWNLQCSANDECFLPCFSLRTDGFKSGAQEQQIYRDYARSKSASNHFLKCTSPRTGLFTFIPRLLLP